MRIWSIHPKYLDARGLVALWREGLLAKRVLEGKTRGYRHHPQLARFMRQKDPLLHINAYLCSIHYEALRRGYGFSRDKFLVCSDIAKIPITDGQVKYEFRHLMKKIASRDRKKYIELKRVKSVKCAPVFRIVKGKVEDWERIKSGRQLLRKHNSRV